MKPRSLAILALVVAALAAFIWFFERDLPSSTERAERSKKVLRFEKGEVRGLSIVAAGETTRFERVEATAPGAAASEASSEGSAAQDWRLLEPMAAPADRWAVERLLDSLEALEKQRDLKGVSRADLGLAEPRGRVTLRLADRSITLEVGVKLPASSSMAVAIEGSPDAAVVPDGLWADLTKPPGEWRSHELFTASRDRVERVTMESGGGRVLLGRRGETFWVEAPWVDLAERSAVDSLLGDLSALRVQEFIDRPAPAAAGLAAPSSIVEVVVRDQAEPFRLEVGAADPANPSRRFARAGGTVVTLETGLEETIRRPVEQWRSTAWSTLEVYRVEGARFETSATAEAIDLTRAGGDWQRGGVAVPFTPVSDLLYAVVGAKSRELVDPKEAARRGADLEAAVMTVTLRSAGGAVTETLRRFRPLVSGEVPVTVSGRDVVLLLDAATAREIDDKLELVRQAEALPAKDAATAE